MTRTPQDWAETFHCFIPGDYPEDCRRCRAKADRAIHSQWYAERYGHEWVE